MKKINRNFTFQKKFPVKKILKGDLGGRRGVYSSSEERMGDHLTSKVSLLIKSRQNKSLLAE
ncbi:hypothetical protein [Desemzia sp. FAM 23991]|uniref:hypothetical protein n=1 Tax=unclassified Desemzia TaxID=2685243 RepID=UPI00388ACDAA